MSRLLFTKLAVAPAAPADPNKQILYTKTDGYWYYKNSAGVEARLGIIVDFASPPPIGNTLANTGAFTTINASGVITAPAGVVGNASTASILLTPRAINGVNFDGSIAITVAAAAGTLTGTTLAVNVVNAVLNAVTPTGGTFAITGALSATALFNLSAATAGQIKFPAIQNASADVNTLDNYKEASYTGTATGLTTVPTASVSCSIVGNAVTLNLPILTGVSNATTFTVTGMPAEARPVTKKTILGRAQDNGGAHVVVRIDIETTGVLTIYSNADTGAFTITGTKSLGECSASYTLV